METDVESYLTERLALLRGRLATVEAKAAAGTLPDVVLKDGDLCISPITASGMDRVPGRGVGAAVSVLSPAGRPD